jgi:pimeloyl-ACP methyl ester carboxylesterase
LAFVGLVGTTARAHAQPPPDDPNDGIPAQMCGNGQTFTVSLPGDPNGLDIDDNTGVFQSIEVPAVPRDDEVKLPLGCRIYAFLISGFGDNEEFDRIIFYKLADFVAKNNGYVHTGWWNNLTKEYMERPLHMDVITILKPFGAYVHIPPTPRTAGIPDEFVNTNLDLPKANPDDDYQFVVDTAKVLKQVRAKNLEIGNDPIIILAGHSMGGNSVARVAAKADVPIDLLAVIDPVGNSDLPRVPTLSDKKFNWTRWRAANEFKGWKKQTCQALSVGGCLPFQIPLFGVPRRWTCVTTGEWLTEEPLLPGPTPWACPSPYEDPGTRITIGANVNYLYHRYQKEFLWPVDFTSAVHFVRPMAVGGLLSGNHQTPFIASKLWQPNATCSEGPDVRDFRFKCSANDGHGEIIGVRRIGHVFEGNVLILDGYIPVRPGLQLEDWPPRSDFFFPPIERRNRLVQLAVEGQPWPYTPQSPNLCLVCDDMIAITQHLMDQQDEEGGDSVRPVSHATSSPEPNAQDWFNDDVVLSVSASDNRSVQEIHLELSGAQSGTTVTPGASAEVTITAEGLTTASYFARDSDGNDELSRTLDIRIDKSAPNVDALTDVPPNLHGWNGGPVAVSFVASDEPGGSGLATSPSPVSVSTEGENQEIAGTAEDNAGNAATTAVTLNIDLTPPEIVAIPDVLPNGNGWNNTDVRVRFEASDGPSGIASSEPDKVVSTEGENQQIAGTAIDRADHTASASLVLNIDKTAPNITATASIPPNSHGWNGSDVVVSFEASDALSGLVSSPEDVTVSNEGEAQSIAGTVEDRAGNTATASLGVSLDKTAPQITASASIAPNSHGWNNSDVVVSFSASDALSGLVSSPADVTVSTEGAGQEIAGTAEDRAGHTASASVVLNIDKTAPQITAGASVAPNGNGWNSGDVVVSFTTSDEVSGLVSSPADVTVSSEGAGQNIAGAAEDRAGNTASASLVLNIDKTAPAIALFSRTPANGAGWNNTDVNVVWNCSDALSGPVADQLSQSLTAEGAGQNAVGTCADRAGHTAGNTQSGINIDKTGPVNQIATPPQGAAYLLNAAVNSTYGCVDTLSGVSACAGPVASGAALDTATVGAKIFTVNSLDAAGNPSVASHAYNVQYAFSGFSNPIVELPALNKARAGRTVMVKYVLRDASGAVLASLASFASLVSAPAACDTNAPTADAEESDAAGATTIRFDSDSGQFVYAWQTQSAWEGTCRVLQLTLLDGTEHTVAFQFR